MVDAVSLAKYAPVLFGAQYYRKILSTQRANLIGYWPLWEASGGTADNLEGTALRDGAYTGVTLGQPGIGDGKTSPFYDGANDYCNIYSASLAGALDGDEGTIAVWAKVNSIANWTDGSNRCCVTLLGNVAGNLIDLRKSTANNTLWFKRNAGGTAQELTELSGSPVDWFHIALTWSLSGDKLIGYLNGTQLGATKTGLAAWTAGGLDTTHSVVGAYSTTPLSGWHGWLAHAAIWTTPLSAADIAKLVQV